MGKFPSRRQHTLDLFQFHTHFADPLTHTAHWQYTARLLACLRRAVCPLALDEYSAPAKPSNSSITCRESTDPGTEREAKRLNYDHSPESACTRCQEQSRSDRAALSPATLLLCVWIRCFQPAPFDLAADLQSQPSSRQWRGGKVKRRTGGNAGFWRLHRHISTAKSVCIATLMIFP